MDRIQPKPKLEIELVPRSAFYNNLRSILEKEDWDILRRLIYKKANYKCQICGRGGEIHCHEVWIYEEIWADDVPDPFHIQKLSFCQALCPRCHEAKHIGLAQLRGYGERATETLKRVNEWDDKEVEAYKYQKFQEWGQRSEVSWKIDINKISDYGIDISKYKLNK